MKRRLTSLLLLISFAFVIPATAQEIINDLPPGSKVYIHPMDGFETYLAAAFQKKKVALVLVADREQAEFEIKGNSERDKAGWSKRIFGSGRDAVRASITISNIKSGVIVVALASDKSDAWSGMKSAAEHIAKHVARKIKEGSER